MKSTNFNAAVRFGAPLGIAFEHRLYADQSGSQPVLPGLQYRFLKPQDQQQRAEHNRVKAQNPGQRRQHHGHQLDQQCAAFMGLVVILQGCPFLRQLFIDIH